MQRESCFFCFFFFFFFFFFFMISGLGKNLYANGLVSSGQWIGMSVIWAFRPISPTNPK
jgi:hypothetical protein